MKSDRRITKAERGQIMNRYEAILGMDEQEVAA
jgi:hypothetical protein